MLRPDPASSRRGHGLAKLATKDARCADARRLGRRVPSRGLRRWIRIRREFLLGLGGSSAGLRALRRLRLVRDLRSDRLLAGLASGSSPWFGALASRWLPVYRRRLRLRFRRLALRRFLPRLRLCCLVRLRRLARLEHLRRLRLFLRLSGLLRRCHLLVACWACSRRL